MSRANPPPMVERALGGSSARRRAPRDASSSRARAFERTPRVISSAGDDPAPLCTPAPPSKCGVMSTGEGDPTPRSPSPDGAGGSSASPSPAIANPTVRLIGRDIPPGAPRAVRRRSKPRDDDDDAGEKGEPRVWGHRLHSPPRALITSRTLIIHRSRLVSIRSRHRSASTASMAYPVHPSIVPLASSQSIHALGLCPRRAVSISRRPPHSLSANTNA